MRLLARSHFAHVFEPLRGRRVGYVRTPGNAGDALIEMGAFQLMKEFEVDVHLLRPGFSPKVDEFVVAGGGSMGNLYPDPRRIREHILTLGRPVTVLPQSFIDREDLPYKRVYVRERDSLRFCPDGVLAPDLALGLDVTAQGNPDLGEAIWLRTEVEGRFGEVRCSGDPARVVKGPTEYLQLAARHTHVITDRLHFAIAALICGRRATLLPNSYHKNRSMYETWLRDLGCGWLDAPPGAAPT